MLYNTLPNSYIIYSSFLEKILVTRWLEQKQKVIKYQNHFHQIEHFCLIYLKEHGAMLAHNEELPRVLSLQTCNENIPFTRTFNFSNFRLIHIKHGLWPSDRKVLYTEPRNIKNSVRFEQFVCTV